MCKLQSTNMQDHFAPVLHPYLSKTLNTSLLEHLQVTGTKWVRIKMYQGETRGAQSIVSWQVFRPRPFHGETLRNWCNRCIDPLSIAQALRGTSRHQVGTKAGASWRFISRAAAPASSTLWPMSGSARQWSIPPELELNVELPVDLYTNVFTIFNLIIWNILKCWTMKSMKSMKYQDSL